MEDNLVKCRNCSYKIEKRLRRCPYCGIMNPTVTLWEILGTTAIIIVVMYILTLIFGE